MTTTTDPVARARAAVTELLAAYRAAVTSDQREGVGREVARLTTDGRRSLSELAEVELEAAREGGP